MVETYYSYFVLLHVLSVLATFAFIFRADALGFAWVRGNLETLDQKKMRALHRYTWYGILVIIASGAVLFYPYGLHLLFLLAFQIKMVFVLIIILNSFFIKYLMIVTASPFASLGTHKKAMLFISGALSGSSWFGAVIASVFLNLK